MKAIVLTYDKQIGLSQLVVRSYTESLGQKLFDFNIPLNLQDNAKYFKGFDSTSLVNSKSDVYSTMDSLLYPLDDEEWVYWAIDDRYPTFIDTVRFISLFNQISRGELDFANGVKLLFWREKPSDDEVKIDGFPFFKQQKCGTFGFWHHHFLKAKVLKDFFLRNNKNKLNNVLLLNDYHNAQDELLFFDDIYVPKNNIIELGEPLVSGLLTKNGLEALDRYKCIKPDFNSTNDIVTFFDSEAQIEFNPKRPKYVTKEDLL
jgi:hypothetical protein